MFITYKSIINYVGFLDLYQVYIIDNRIYVYMYLYSTKPPVENHNYIVSKKLHMKPELVFPVVFRESKSQLNYHVSNSTETPLELSHILTETSHEI